MAVVCDDRGRMAGARHVSVLDAGRGRRALVMADVLSETADEALSRLQRLGVPPDDISLVRLETIGTESTGEPLVLVWADVLAQARVRARAPGLYLVLMAVAGVIAGLGPRLESSASTSR